MITLASDFGTPYPAAMKGVVLQRTDARLVDVAHDFPRQDVRATAFWLREVLPWFPPAVHLVVVDPGVGTDRAALVVRAGDHALVGPDNGVLVPAARALAGGTGDGGAGDDDGTDGNDDGTDGDEFEVFEWRYADGESEVRPASDERAVQPRARSSTFHGRDVFAPAAAAVHEAGVANVEALDPANPADEWVDLTFPEPGVEGEQVVGEVLAVDGFGNVITNVPGDVLDGVDRVVVNSQEVPADRSYAHVPEGQWLATVGSHGNVELAVNRGRGDEAFDLVAGDEVRLAFG